MEQIGDEGALHMLLSSLPDIHDGQPSPDTGVSADARDDEEEDENESTKPETVGNPFDSETETVVGSDIGPGTGGGELESENGLASKKAQAIPVTVFEASPQDQERDSTEERVSFDTLEENTQSRSRGTSRQPSSSRSSSSSSSFSQPFRKRRNVVSLPDLLTQADELYESYPPTAPELFVDSILAPKSALFTWSEDPKHALPDDEAEEIARHLELVVLPFEDPDEVREKEELEAKEKEKLEREQNRRKEKEKGWRNRKKGRRGLGLSAINSRTAVAGAVVVVGIAAAVYSVKHRGGGGRSGLFNVERTGRAGQWLANTWLEGNIRLLNALGR